MSHKNCHSNVSSDIRDSGGNSNGNKFPIYLNNKMLNLLKKIQNRILKGPALLEKLKTCRNLSLLLVTYWAKLIGKTRDFSQNRGVEK